MPKNVGQRPQNQNPQAFRGTVGGSRPTFNWDEITSPGAYVDSQGHLYRIPQEALNAGHGGPSIRRVTAMEDTLTQISEEPFVPVSQARGLAAACDVQPNF